MSALNTVIPVCGSEDIALWRSIVHALTNDERELSDIDVHTSEITPPSSVIEIYGAIKLHEGWNRGPYSKSKQRTLHNQYRPVNDAVRTLCPRLAGFTTIYPAVINGKDKKGQDTYYWVGYVGNSTTRSYLCCHKICKQNVHPILVRVHSYVDDLKHPVSTHDSRVLCRYGCQLKLFRNETRSHYSQQHYDQHKKDVTRRQQQAANGTHNTDDNTVVEYVRHDDDDMDMDMDMDVQCEPMYELLSYCIPDDQTNNDVPYKPIQRQSARQFQSLFDIKIVTLDYYCTTIKQNKQWVPHVCSYRSNTAGQSTSKRECACSSKSNTEGCRMYLNGFTLRWVYSNPMPWLAVIPHYRCATCRCAGGAFTSAYHVPDNVRVTPDIIACGGQLGQRVFFCDRTFYQSLIRWYSTHFNAAEVSRYFQAGWRDALAGRKRDYDVDILMDGYVDPGNDPVHPDYYYGLRMPTGEQRKLFYNRYIDELSRICNQNTLTSEWISDLYFETYVPTELNLYTKLVQMIMYAFGFLYLLHDHSYYAVKSHHIQVPMNPDGTPPLYARLMVQSQLSTIMCLVTKLIVDATIVPSTACKHVIPQLASYIKFRREMNEPDNLRLRSIGVDNAVSAEDGLAAGIYGLLLPVGEQDRHGWFNSLSVEFRNTQPGENNKLFYKRLVELKDTFIAFTEDIFHLKQRILDKGSTKQHPMYGELYKAVSALFNRLGQTPSPTQERITHEDFKESLLHILKRYGTPQRPAHAGIIGKRIELQPNQQCQCSTCSDRQPNNKYKPPKPVTSSTSRKKLKSSASRKHDNPSKPGKRKRKDVAALADTDADIAADAAATSTSADNKFQFTKISQMGWCESRQEWVYRVHWRTEQKIQYTITYEPIANLMTDNGEICDALINYFDRTFTGHARPVLTKSGRTSIVRMIVNVDNIFNILELRRMYPDLLRNSGTNLVEAWHSVLNGLIMKKGMY